MRLECCQGGTSLPGITATVVHQAGNACSGLKRTECEVFGMRRFKNPRNFTVPHHLPSAETNLMSKKIANGGTP
jgi:hypothetical protein